MVLVQKWPVFQFFFSGHISQKNLFYDILQRKSAFQGYKNKKSKKSKNSHLAMGLAHNFQPKKAISQILLLGNIGQKMSFMTF